MSVYFTRRGPAPALGKRASDYAVGDIVKIKEKEPETEFIVVHQGNPNPSIYDGSCDGTWLIRKNVIGPYLWAGVPYVNNKIHQFLNGDYLKFFDEKALAAMKTVKIPYFEFAQPALSSPCLILDKGLPTKAFLPSEFEVGISFFNYQYKDGALLDYFLDGNSAEACEKRKGGLPSAEIYPLRTPSTMPGTRFMAVSYVGQYAGGAYMGDVNCYQRPLIVIDKATAFDPETNILKG